LSVQQGHDIKIVAAMIISFMNYYFQSGSIMGSIASVLWWWLCFCIIAFMDPIRNVGKQVNTMIKVNLKGILQDFSLSFVLVENL